MTEPNVLGGDYWGAKWIFEDTDTKPISLFRENASGDFPATDLSMHTPSSGSLTGIPYEVPAGKQFRLLDLEYMVDSVTIDMSFGIIASTAVDDPSAGTKVWNWFFENSTIDWNYAKKFQFGGGLHFPAGTFVTLYNLDGLTNCRYVCSAWGVEYDA